jgi:endonuclease/exonuclease/phosphatase family metal-dependent hydrolase
MVARRPPRKWQTRRWRSIWYPWRDTLARPLPHLFRVWAASPDIGFDGLEAARFDQSMFRRSRRQRPAAIVLAALLGLTLSAWTASPAGAFTVATYNLENYLAAPVGDRAAKSAEGKARIREAICRMRPDVLALQEVGSRGALLELRAALKTDGLEYPDWEFVTGHDTNIFVAVLSRFPIVARRAHTNENFLLRGRRYQVSRGFAEVDVRVTARYAFTLITAHLKSRRQVGYADEGELREQEAIRLRGIVEARLRANPRANLVVLGDFNDTKDSSAIRRLLGDGRTRLVDTRPAERNGDDAPSSNPRWVPRRVTWTHFYGVEDSYDRIDYILVSPGMAAERDEAASYVLAMPNWGVASDHRPVVAAFVAEER